VILQECAVMIFIMFNIFRIYFDWLVYWKMLSENIMGWLFPWWMTYYIKTS